MSIEEMRDQISLFCEVEGFCREAKAAYTMSGEEVRRFFFELFPHEVKA
jgi:hypothetical protein